MKRPKLTKDDGTTKTAETLAEVIPQQVLGTWINTNPMTRGIGRVILRTANGHLIMQAFGVCDPSPCDWGESRAPVFTEEICFPEVLAFNVFYDFGFMETHLLAHVKLGVLVVAKFDRFKDGSGRSNYFSREFFCRLDR